MLNTWNKCLDHHFGAGGYCREKVITIFRSARTSWNTFVRPFVRPSVRPQEKSKSPLKPYNTAVMLHWEGRMKTGPKWPVNRSQDLLLQICLYQHFFFNRPYLGNETRFFKCVSGKILVSSRAFIHSFMKVTSPNSFILFRPLSWKKAHFQGVPGGPNWATLVQNMPLGPLLMVKKKNLRGKLNWMLAPIKCEP